VNNKYIQRYPDNPDSKDLLFENARYYLKLDDLTNANRIYDEFAMRYPDDPRTIEAYFRRGEYYYENQQFSQARIELQKAISRSDQFARTGRDPNLFFASESYFMLGEIEYVDYKNITLSYPEATLRSQLQQKQNKLRAVIDAFTTVIKMGSLKGFEAMFKVAEAYEELGNAIAEQQLTPNLTPERRLVERDRVFKASVPAYDRAVEEYKNVIENIPVYAQKLEVNIFDTTSVAPVDTAGLQDSPEVIQKVAFQDSTRDIALKWYNESRVKVSSILYTVAERSTEFIDAYLRQENPARGLVYLSWKKLLLERAVAPAVNVTLTSHLKNITISKELNLQNKFVNESERKILLTSNVLAEEYGKLFKNAVQQYQTDMPTLYQLIEGGESATTPDGLNSMDFNDQLMSIIDYMNEFITTGLTQFTNTLKFAQDNQINNDAVLTTQDHLFNLSYESGITMLGLSQNVNSKIKEYEVIADSTGDQKYQLGIVYLYDQESILNDYAKQQLADVYQISKDYEIKNVWTNLILAKLVELSPADYLSDFPSEILTFTSGPDWNGSAIYALDWITSEFNDSEWKNVSVVTLPTTMIFPGFDSLQTPPPSIWLFTDISLADSLTTLQPPPVSVDTLLPSDSVPRPRSLDLEEKEIPEEMTTTPRTLLSESGTLPVATAPDTVTAYFRKKFNLQDRVINGYALITADNQYHFYLNGEYIKGNENNLFESVDRVEYIELGDFVKTGENLIAIDVTDINGAPHYGLRFYLQLEILPLEITAAAERIRQKAAENVDENQLRTIVVLNKNRVPAK
jgi:tetratricopeptide (TPR) repeat protein